MGSAFRVEQRELLSKYGKFWGGIKHMSLKHSKYVLCTDPGS